MSSLRRIVIGNSKGELTSLQPAIRSSPNLKLVAVYSRSLKSAQDTVGDVPSATLYSEDAGTGKGLSDLLAREDVQAVIIACVHFLNAILLLHCGLAMPANTHLASLPISAQPPYIKQCLAAGKHVFSEKPIAPSVKEAEELLEWYKARDSKATWSVAENHRYLDSVLYGAKQVQKLGRILHFRAKSSIMIKPEAKYYQTKWRQNPAHQGGFVLDGGVHYIASLRMLLGEENDISRVCAFSTQLQPHLPPIDTVNAVLKTKTGIIGLFASSHGTTELDNEWFVAGENGTVTARRYPHQVVTKINDKEEKEEFPDEAMGVGQEVRAWASGLENGNVDERQSPKEALRDLQVVSTSCFLIHSD